MLSTVRSNGTWLLSQLLGMTRHDPEFRAGLGPDVSSPDVLEPVSAQTQYTHKGLCGDPHSSNSKVGFLQVGVLNDRGREGLGRTLQKSTRSGSRCHFLHFIDEETESLQVNADFMCR